MTMILDLEALQRAPVTTSPFVFTVASGCLRPESQPLLQRDFPRIDQPGSFPVSELSYGPSFAALLDELRGREFGQAISGKLGVDLAGFPLLITVRGQSRRRDGGIHTDAVWKLATVLIYMNAPWQSQGGRLRLLRSENLDDAAAEVSPEFGSLLAFKRSDRSLHGHKPFEGERRLVQINWVTSQDKIASELARHRRTARLKRFFPFLANVGY